MGANNQIDKLSEKNFELLKEADKYLPAVNKYNKIMEEVFSNQIKIQSLKRKLKVQEEVPAAVLDFLRSEAKAVAGL